MIREICKAGWLQQKVVKRTVGVNKWSKAPKTIYLPEKWYILCVHDDRFPFLEVYSSDDSVSRHEPLETLNLNECQYIITAIEDDRTFVIAFQNDGRSSLELAALSALERREWMDMLRFKLTQLGCLETGNNIYSPFPVAARRSSNSSLQDSALSNPSLPVSTASNESAAPGPSVEERSAVQSLSRSYVAEDSADHTYEPPLRSLVGQEIPVSTEEAQESMAPVVSRLPFNEGIYEPISHVERSRSSSHTPPSEFVLENADDSAAPSSMAAPSYSVIKKEEKPVLPPRNLFGATWSNGSIEVTHRRQPSESSFYDVPRGVLSPTLATSPSPRPAPPVPARSSIERYDPLPMESTIRRSIEESATVSNFVSSPTDTDSVNNNTTTNESVSRKSSAGTHPDIQTLSFDNPGFDEDEDSSRHYANGPLFASPEVEIQDDRRGPYSSLSGRARMVPWQLLNTKPSSSISAGNNVRAHSNSPSSSSSETVNIRSKSRSVSMIKPVALPHSTPSVPMEEDETPSPPTSPPPAPPLPPPNGLTIPNGQVKSLKETEVERLHIEMDSDLPVKAHVLLEHLVNENGHLTGLALVDMIGYAWIAGWLKRLTKQFSAGLHIGDRLDSIFDADGKAVAINSVAKAEQVLRECWKRRRSQVSFLVKRLPLGRAYFLKRAANGESVGIVLKGAKNEILAIEEGKAAHRAGMQVQCKSKLSDTLVNYFITEVNGRPLNMFAKDGEAQKRLSAVGTEITVLVQPCDFVKELRKKLKHKKGHKEYIIG